MSGPRHTELVLALYPFARGIAFTFFEAPLSPIDWGIKEVRGPERTARALEVAKSLIDRLQPDSLVLADPTDQIGKRSERVKRVEKLIVNYAIGQSVDVHRYSRTDIRACFRGVGARTRYEIAQAIAAQIHAFGLKLPPVRKIWKREDERMSLFDAASLAMTHYCAGEPLPPQDY